MIQQQQLLVQTTLRILKQYNVELKELANPPGSPFIYMVEIIQAPEKEVFTETQTEFSFWVEALKLIAKYNLIHTDDGVVVAVIAWKPVGHSVESLINLALRTSIMARTAKITQMHAEIEKVTVELEQFSSLIGRI